MKSGDKKRVKWFELMYLSFKVTFLVWILLFCNLSFARENCVGLYCPQDQIVLKGEYFKAISIAVADFQKVLQKNAKRKKSKLSLFLSDINNFVILISKDDGGVIELHFHPNNFQDSPVKGGGASYKIDSETFKIIEKEYSM